MAARGSDSKYHGPMGGSCQASKRKWCRNCTFKNLRETQRVGACEGGSDSGAVQAEKGDTKEGLPRHREPPGQHGQCRKRQVNRMSGGEEECELEGRQRA